jgi:hypothetical protein
MTASEWIEGEVLARWETRGKDWLELYRGAAAGNFWYRGGPTYCGGGFSADSDNEAVERMEYPWGHYKGTGQATVLRSDRPSLRMVFSKKACRKETHGRDQTEHAGG